MVIEKLIEEAKIKLSEEVVNLRAKGLPMYIIELIVEGVLNDIKDAKTREMVVKLQEKVQEEENDHGELRDESTEI